jgi:hypothetical protein
VTPTCGAYIARTTRIDRQIAADREVEGSIMHVQARSAPALSPPDLVAFLQVLAADETLNRDAINIEGVTGSAIEEDGGRLVFTVTHGRAREAHERLRGVGYPVQWTIDLYAEKIPPNQESVSQENPNQPGVLLGIVTRAKEHVNAGGRGIDTLLIGEFTNKPGRFFCQCTWLNADWRESPPDDEGEEED